MSSFNEDEAKVALQFLVENDVGPRHPYRQFVADWVCAPVTWFTRFIVRLVGFVVGVVLFVVDGLARIRLSARLAIRWWCSGSDPYPRRAYYWVTAAGGGVVSSMEHGEEPGFMWLVAGIPAGFLAGLAFLVVLWATLAPTMAVLARVYAWARDRDSLEPPDTSGLAQAAWRRWRHHSWQGKSFWDHMTDKDRRVWRDVADGVMREHEMQSRSDEL